MKKKKYDSEDCKIFSLLDNYLDSGRLRTDLQEITKKYQEAERALAKYSNRDKKRKKIKAK